MLYILWWSNTVCWQNPSFRFVALFSQFQCPFSSEFKGRPSMFDDTGWYIPMIFPFCSHDIPIFPLYPDDIPIFFLVNHSFVRPFFLLLTCSIPGLSSLLAWVIRRARSGVANMWLWDCPVLMLGGQRLGVATWETLIWHHMTKYGGLHLKFTHWDTNTLNKDLTYMDKWW